MDKYWQASLEMEHVTAKERQQGAGGGLEPTWQHLSHENVHKFIGMASNCRLLCGEIKTMLVFEACDDNLHAYLKRSERPSLATATNWACQIASGLKYLHACKEMVHRRLCSSAIMMRYEHYADGFDDDFGDDFNTGSTTTLKISLLEHAVPINSVVRRPPASMSMAPEALGNAPAKYSEDVWSLGIILWELATGCTAHQGMPTAQALHQIRTTAAHPRLPEKVPRVMRRVMRNCWNVKYHERPSASSFIAMLENDEPSEEAKASRQAVPVADQADSYQQQQALPRATSMEGLKVRAGSKVKDAIGKMRRPTSFSGESFDSSSVHSGTPPNAHADLFSQLLDVEARSDPGGEALQPQDSHDDIIGPGEGKQEATAAVDDYTNCNSVELVIHAQADSDVLEWMKPLRIKSAAEKRKSLSSVWSSIKWTDVLDRMNPQHSTTTSFAPNMSQAGPGSNQRASGVVADRFDRSMIARTHCIDRSKHAESCLGLHVFADSQHDSVMILKVEPASACSFAWPAAPKCGDVIVGVNGKYVAGKGLDAVLNEIAAADKILVLNVTSPMQVLATRGN